MVNINKGNLSPMMRHYFTMKEKYSDSLLFFRLGDFYEMFFDDAIIASKVLELTLTGRDCGLIERAPMCGVPHHAAESYIAKLVDNGYRVAICEQLTTPDMQKGMVERDVVRVITPGTVTEDSMLEENKNNYMASVIIDKKYTGMAWADISTGEFYLYQFENSDKILQDMLISIRPKEIISPESTYYISEKLPVIKAGDIPQFSIFSDWAYDFTNSYGALTKQLNVQTLMSYEIEDKKTAIMAGGALIEFFNETQKRSLAHINNLRYIKYNSYMFLDAQTRRNLELTETMRDNSKKGSLLWVLDKTNTHMGARLIHKWINQPLINSQEINKRLDMIEELVNNNSALENINGTLSKIRDLERLAGKIAYNSINPKDTLAILQSLSFIPSLKSYIEKLQSQLAIDLDGRINTMEKLCQLLESAISPDAPMVLKDGGYIRMGYNDDLDRLRELRDNAEQYLLNIEAAEKQATGIKKLKIGYNKVFGYYIDIPRSESQKVPYRFIRKQTLSNSERYITEELKEIEDKILASENDTVLLETKLFEEIKEILKTYIITMQSTAEAISVTDVISSFAVVAITNNYIKPIINDTISCIDIKEGRHLVVEKMLSSNEFVSNDTLLNHKNRTMIITGPNMAGKSTYMRQVALITLLAHIGSFVPASKAKVSITDRIFTRIGASDDLAYGQSTFMVEMLETASILNNATDKSLLILDEVGRGTSTLDGLSIAWAVMEHITANITAKTLFATHYHELTALEDTISGVVNYKILVREYGDSIIFLHKIAKGGTDKSFGIEVASIAGIPNSVIARAKDLSVRLDFDRNLTQNVSDISQNTKPDISKHNEIINKLKQTSLDNCTPLEAMILLAELKGKVD